MTSRFAFKAPPRRPAKERGAVLIISLVVLMAFTIFVVTMINSSSSSFVVIGNQQTKKRLDAAAKEAIERSLNDQTRFTGALAGSATVQNWTINGYNVQVSIPYCYGAKNPPGYSSLSSVAPEDTHWRIVATARDPATGATSELTQGVKIRFGSGNCGEAF